MICTNPIRAPRCALPIALTLVALAIPQAALAYDEKDAIRDCESRIRSEYGVSDFRGPRAERLMDSAHHYKVQGSVKVDGDKHPWTCEVKNRHVTSAEYHGPKPEGLNTGQKLAIGAAAAVAAGVAASEMSKHKAGTEQTASAGAGANKRYPNRCEIYSSGKRLLDTLPCAFSQHQGGVNIDLSDGASFSLDPVGSTPGTYVEMASNDRVYRKSGLGSKGTIFQFPTQSIHVFY